jgi:hypothetical protein
MKKEYTIAVYTIDEDGLPPPDYEGAGLVGRVAFLFDGSLYSGWPLQNGAIWEDAETAHHFAGVTKWIELPVAGWDL